MYSKIRFILLFSLLSFLSSLSYARLNVSVTEDPWIYTTVDQLIAFGLVDDALLSQKPISLSEVLRIKNQAKENLKRIEGKEIETRVRLLLKQLEEALPKDPPKKKFAMTPLKKLRTEYLYVDSPERVVLPNISAHRINAITNPIVAYRNGRPFGDGQNFHLETAHELSWEPYFSISGQPQFFLLKRPDTTNDTMQWSFDHLYLRSEIKNIGLQIGRDQIVWGPTPLKGNVFSANARGHDMFKISNISPFHLPWIFKYLGFMDASFFFSVLESKREFPYAYISAFKLSFLPHHNIQFGFTAATMSGGKGSPHNSLGSRIADPFVGYIFNLAGGTSPMDSFASNRIGGFDLKWRMPSLRGTEFYYELIMEDISKYYRFYLESFNRAGFYIPRLSSDGRHALRLEFNHSGFLPYRHEQFISGWTHNRHLMGDELGPDGIAGHVDYEYHPTPYWMHHASLSLEKRDSDLYRVLNNQPVPKTSNGPTETRLRFTNGFERKLTETLKLGMDWGIERITQFNFVLGNDGYNFLAAVKVTLFPKY